MRRQARIVRVSEDILEAVLEKPAEACATCKHGCGKWALNWFAGKKHDRVLIVRYSAWARNKWLPVKQALVDGTDFFGPEPCVDQRFTLEFNDDAMLKNVVWLYAMPLVTMVSGLGLGYLVFSGYGWPGDLGGILGLVTGLLISRRLVGRHLPETAVRFS